jgi:hypothetical protein
VSPLKLVNTLLAASTPSDVHIYSLKCILRTHDSFIEVLDTIMRNLRTPKTSLFRDEIIAFMGKASLKDYVAVVTLLI